MQTQQIIRASAEVLTITHLAPGNVYKRVETSYSGDAVLRFGIVQDVMNNGEDAAVTALEFAPDYATGATTAIKVWDGSKPVAIYPAQPEEVSHHFTELLAATEDASRRAEEALEKARTKAAEVRRVIDQHGAALTAPATTREVTA